MVVHLLESTHHPRRSVRDHVRGALPSIGVHAVLIAGAVAATNSALGAVHETRQRSDTLIIYHAPRPIRTVEPSRRGGVKAANGSVLPRTAMPDAPPITVPVTVPTRIPLPGEGGRPLVDTRDFGRGIGGNAGPERGDGTAGTGGPRSALEVDRVAAPLHPVDPVYPAQLRAAAVTGSVLAEFVVDSTGRMVPESFRVIDSANDLFTEAVRGALLRTRFHPAEVAGRPVSQLARETFTFVLQR